MYTRILTKKFTKLLCLKYYICNNLLSLKVAIPSHLKIRRHSIHSSFVKHFFYHYIFKVVYMQRVCAVKVVSRQTMFFFKLLLQVAAFMLPIVPSHQQRSYLYHTRRTSSSYTSYLKLEIFKRTHNHCNSAWDIFTSKIKINIAPKNMIDYIYGLTTISNCS